MACTSAGKYDPDTNRYSCQVTGDDCMFMRPDSTASTNVKPIRSTRRRYAQNQRRKILMGVIKHAEIYRWHTIWRYDNEQLCRVSQNGVQLAEKLERMEAVRFINKKTGSDSDTWDFRRIPKTSERPNQPSIEDAGSV